MADFLSYVERNYGSVAEYNRCREEVNQEAYEKEMRAIAYYKRNKEKLNKVDADGTLIYFSEDCYECPHYTDIGPTDEYDDVPHGICGNLGCNSCEFRQRNGQ